MKTLIIQVPQWYPMNPYLAGAVLVGEMKNAGYEAETYDMNIEFFNDILTADFVRSSFVKAKSFLKEFNGEAEKNGYTEEKFSTYSPEVKTKLYRRKAIEEYLLKHSAGVENTINTVEDSVALLKDKERFYDPELHFLAKDTIIDALEIISLPYQPNKLTIDNYISNPFLTYNYEDIKKQCFDESMNMFIEYYERKLKEINLSEYDVVGISISDLSQVIPGLTLARMIKERSGVYVTLGGNYLYKIREEMKKIPELFSEYCDSMLIGDGEIAIVRLMQCIEGKYPMSEAWSLMYDDGKTITETADAPLLKMNELSIPDFSGYKMEKYFSPSIILPIQCCKGCYWGKCTFCDFYTGQQKFDIKSPRHVMDEIEDMYNKYGCEDFRFVDEAVPPKFYNELANLIRESGLKITYGSFVRFDNGFTREVLQNMYDTGGTCFFWGYEAESERVLKLMNKGIDVSVRSRILHEANDIGLWNHCTFLLGYPTETVEETMLTEKVICNRELIHSCTPSNFALKKNAILYDDTASLGIKNVTDNGEFHISCSYDFGNKKIQDIKKMRMDFQNSFLEKTRDSLWSLSFTDVDHMQLYIKRYGAKRVRRYRLKRPKTHIYG